MTRDKWLKSIHEGFFQGAKKMQDEGIAKSISDERLQDFDERLWELLDELDDLILG